MRIGVSLYQPEDAADALRAYAEIVPTLSRSVGWHGTLKDAMPALPFVPPELVGKRVLMLFSMWLEDAYDTVGTEVVERLGAVGNPCLKATEVLPFAGTVQRFLDEEFAGGHRYYTREAHVAELTGEAIDKMIEFWKNMPMCGEIEIIGLGDAIDDVDEDATAFSNRNYPLWLNFAMSWDNPSNDADYLSRTRKIVQDLAPWIGQGIYVNMLNFDEMDRVVEAFGGLGKYTQLGRVKALYDPENFFRVNYNIVPVTD
jgi:hypothetical protein